MQSSRPPVINRVDFVVCQTTDGVSEPRVRIGTLALCRLDRGLYRGVRIYRRASSGRTCCDFDPIAVLRIGGSAASRYASVMVAHVCIRDS